MARPAKPTLKAVPPPPPDAENAPTPATDALAGPAADPKEELAALVERVRAQSRAALEAKVQKIKAREAKRANLASDKAYRSQKPAAMRLEQVWRDRMAQKFPNVPQMAWFKREGMKVTARKEGKLVADLIDGYDGNEALVEEILTSYVDRWEHFGPMLTKQGNSIPTIGLLYAAHATVLAETIRLRDQNDVVAQYEAWKAENMADPFAVPPPELEAAYKATLAKRAKK